MAKEIKLYKGKVKLLFDEESHVFYGPAGERILSVTGVTGLMDKSGPLMAWAVNQMGDYLQENWNPNITEMEFSALLDKARREYRVRRQKEADIGTKIHDWVSSWIKGENPEMPKDDSVLNGVMAFLEFQKKHRVKWQYTERAVYSIKHNYAGWLDAIGKSKDFGNTLMDFKTGNGIYEDMVLQTAAYQLAYEEETGKKIDSRLIVRFGKNDGQFYVKVFQNHERDQRAFINLLKVKRRTIELKEELK